jgi:hypothetical protein
VVPDGRVGSLVEVSDGVVPDEVSEPDVAVGAVLVVGIVTELAKETVDTVAEVETWAAWVRKERAGTVDDLEVLALHADLDFLNEVTVPFEYEYGAIDAITEAEVTADEGLDMTKVAPPAADEDAATEAAEVVTTSAELEALAIEVAEAPTVCDVEMAPE